MIRWLAISLVLLVIWMLLRRALAQLRRSPYGQFADVLLQALRGSGPTGAAGQRGTGGRRGSAPIPLVRCAGCGTHVPEASARRQGDRTFCSEACERRAGP